MMLRQGKFLFLFLAILVENPFLTSLLKASNFCVPFLLDYAPNVRITEVSISMNPQSDEEDGHGYLILHFDKPVRNRGGVMHIPNSQAWAEVVNEWALAGRPLKLLSDPRYPYDGDTHTLLLEHFEAHNIAPSEQNFNTFARRRAELLKGKEVFIQLEAAPIEFSLRVLEASIIRGNAGFHQVVIKVDQRFSEHLTGYARIYVRNGEKGYFYHLSCERIALGANGVSLSVGQSDQAIPGFVDLRSAPASDMFEMIYVDADFGFKVDEFVENIVGSEIRLNALSVMPFHSLDTPFAPTPTL